MRGKGNRFEVRESSTKNAIVIVVDEALEAETEAMAAYLPIIAMGGPYYQLSSRPSKNSPGQALFEQMQRDSAALMINSAVCADCRRAGVDLGHSDRLFPCPHCVVNLPVWKIDDAQLAGYADDLNLPAEIVAVELGNAAGSELRAFDGAAVARCLGAPFPLPTYERPSHVFIGVDPAEGGSGSRYIGVALAPHVHCLWLVGMVEIDVDPQKPEEPPDMLRGWLYDLLAAPALCDAKFHIAVEGNTTTASALATNMLREVIRGFEAEHDARLATITEPGGDRGRLRQTPASKTYGVVVLQTWINCGANLHPKYAPCFRVAEEGVYQRRHPACEEIAAAAVCTATAAEFLAFDRKKKSACGDDRVMALIVALMAVRVHTWIMAHLSTNMQPPAVSYRSADLDLYAAGVGEWIADEPAPKKTRTE